MICRKRPFVLEGYHNSAGRNGMGGVCGGSGQYSRWDWQCLDTGSVSVDDGQGAFSFQGEFYGRGNA